MLLQHIAQTNNQPFFTQSPENVSYYNYFSMKQLAVFLHSVDIYCHLTIICSIKINNLILTQSFQGSEEGINLISVYIALLRCNIHCNVKVTIEI